MTSLVLNAFRDMRTPKLDRVWLASFAVIALIAIFKPDDVSDRVWFGLTALAHTMPYVLFACLIIGAMAAAGAQSVLAKAFEGREIRMIFCAALLGALAPFCSCEVIPFIAALLVAGAPLSAVMAFWLASPIIDPPTLLITAAALGWPFAIGKMAAAIGIGVMGGFGIRSLQGVGALSNPLRPQSPASSCCGCGPDPMTQKPVWKFWQEKTRVETFGKEAGTNLLFLIKWMFFAYMLEAVMVAYVPAEAIVSVVGGEGLGAIVIGALVGAPAYLNGYAAAPLVAGLMEQGMSAGSAMAFILAGGMTCVPAMAAVWALVRPSVFACYIGLAFIGAVLAGVLYSASV
ncbi:MAG: permease [Alphaproteobacteria bacterium]|nr:permease [Alphaproteobacteria bacterium]